MVARAFGLSEWREAVGAFCEATGLALSIVDLQTGAQVFSTARCGHCHLAADAVVPAPSECFDAAPAADSAACHTTCREGLATHLTPIVFGGHLVAHALLSGYASSTRERRRLYERLLGRGVREEAARLAVRGLPAVTRREVESYGRWAASTACAVLAAVDDPVSPGPSEGSLHPVDALLEASISAAGAGGRSSDIASPLLESALDLFGAEAGTIALRRLADYVEIVASVGSGVAQAGTRFRLKGGAAARTLETGRTTVVRGTRGQGPAHAITMVAALLDGDTPSGILELRLPSGRSAGARDVRRVERFARLVALALSHGEQRFERERALADAVYCDGVATTLAAMSDAGTIATSVLSALGRALKFDVAGLIVTSRGKERADLLLEGDVTTAEVAMLLSQAAGRDVAAQPFGSIGYQADGSSPHEATTVRDGWTFVSTALSAADHLIGYLFCASVGGVRFSAQDSRLLEGVGLHAALALDRAELLAGIRDDFAKTVAALSSSLGASDHASRGRSARVMENAMLIGRELGFDPNDLERLRFAGLLHDVGMTAVTEKMVLEPIGLTDDEACGMRLHTELGATIAEQIGLLGELTPIILHHHERWDGSGYPLGLAGEEIPLLARILAVADALDAYTSGTQCRAKMSIAAVRAELLEESGRAYDPGVVAALLDVLDRQALAGSTGLLAGEPSKGRRDLLVEESRCPSSPLW